MKSAKETTKTRQEKRKNLKLNFTESSGNIFADLGFDNAEAQEMNAKADLAIQIIKIIDKKKLTQTEAAVYLGTSQPNISRLNNADIDRFTFDKLMQWLVKLDQNIRLQVSPKKRTESYASISASRV